MNVYRLTPNVEEFCLLYPLESEQFSRRAFPFRGKKLADRWHKIECSFDVSNEQAIPDIAGFQTSGDMVYSPKAIAILKPILESTGELLPVEVNGETWFIHNVTECIRALDTNGSEWDEFEGERLTLEKEVFFSDPIHDVYLFKIPENNHTVTYAVDNGDMQGYTSTILRENLSGLKVELLETRNSPYLVDDLFSAN